MSFSRLLALIVLLASGICTVCTARGVASAEPAAVRVVPRTCVIVAAPVQQESNGDGPNAVNVALISALAGLTSGILASLIAPLINWKIERRRYSLEYRQGIIAAARANAQPGFSSKAFVETHSFFQLKDELPRALVDRLKDDLYVGVQHAQEQMRTDLLAEIALIEKRWFL